MEILPPLQSLLPDDWKAAIAPFFDFAVLDSIDEFLTGEIQSGHIVFPQRPNIFRALTATPFDQVRAVILGQDPYHDDNQACGLAFAVPPGIQPPPSLKNIVRELGSDLNAIVLDDDISRWSTQGVLMLNTVLTVRAHEPNSHKKIGWEIFTDAIIKAISARRTPAVFILWGAPAQKKLGLIDTSRHGIVTGVHPSPLSAYRGFFGSKPFSTANQLLKERGLPEIEW